MTDALPELAAPWTVPYDDRATKADILACFRLILGRNPNPEEWPGHSAREGEALPGVVASYVNSLEFARRRLQEPACAEMPEIAELEGFRMFARADDLAVGRAVLSGQYEPEVVAVFRNALRPGMRVIDVGANIGFFTMLAATLVGPSGSVLAIEPNGRNARMAEASRRLNGFANVTVLQAAAGREAGLLGINTSYSNGTTATLEDHAVLQADTVACVPIDGVVASAGRVDLIKLDVEGAEYNALLGCRNVLQRDRPLLVFEFSPGQLPGISGVSGEELLQWLVGRNYAFEIIQHGGSTLPVGQEWTRVMQSYRERGLDHIDVLARPRRSISDRLRRLRG